MIHALEWATTVILYKLLYLVTVTIATSILKRDCNGLIEINEFEQHHRMLFVELSQSVTNCADCKLELAYCG